MERKLFVSAIAASSMTRIVPTTSRKRFIAETVINLPAFVKGKIQIAQQMLAASAMIVPTDVMLFCLL
jgi:hypothetical protein